MPVNDQIEILNTTNGLPPLAWLELCKTPDQLCYWENIKVIFQKTNYQLQLFFSGEAPSPSKLLSFEDEVYRLYSRKFTDLYSVIYYSFNELKAKASELNIDIPAKPGEYLSHCLKEEAILKFFHCQSYFEFRPRKLTKLHQDINKYPNLKVKKYLDIHEKKLIKNLSIQGERIRKKRLDITPLQLLVLEVASASKDEEVKVSLRIFDNTCARLAQLLNGKLHPRNKPESYTFNKGYFIT